jgi:diketogulonate reductase-like aldo/keto reductase
MILETHSPIGTGKTVEVPQMQTLSKKYGKAIAPLCVRRSLRRGFLPLPKSVTTARIKENTGVFGFELSEDDVQRIAGLKGCVGYAQNPDTVSF